MSLLSHWPFRTGRPARPGRDWCPGAPLPRSPASWPPPLFCKAPGACAGGRGSADCAGVAGSVDWARGGARGGTCAEHISEVQNSRQEKVPSTMMNADMDAVEAENQVELEEKTRLINQVLELQHTLEDLSARVDAVKEENLKLKSENQVLGQYIENLMSASSVFQTTDTKSKRK
ncbi:UNVERIFIED_CONTAM: hypothetical protein K2H54_075970 [Gekko kuhli]